MPLVIYYLDAVRQVFRSPGGPDITPPTPYGELGYGQDAYGIDPYGSPEES